MRVRFEGHCYLCDDGIEEGEEIDKYDDRWAHVRCIQEDQPVTIDTDPVKLKEQALDKRFGFKRMK